MKLNDITPAYAAMPQISAEDMAALKDAGISLIICNRPDEEVPPDLSAAAVRAAAEAAGIAFADNPVGNSELSLDHALRQGELVAGADGRVLAYCRSGTRSSILWALSQAGAMPTDEILAACAAAGFPLEQLRPTLETLSEQA
ncbi:MAG: TIGR01244 family sulfur transferase [Pseudomonadota bacterium]